jgi:hypothetical protein
MTGRETPDAASPAATTTPCRPYRIGDHSTWLRGRLLRSMLAAALIAGLAWGAIPLALVIAVPTSEMRSALTIGGPLIFPVVFAVVHWAMIGRRRWRMVEALVWAGQEQARAFRTGTGIRDPTDRTRAAEWLAEHPAADDDPAEVIVWRAHAFMLLDDPSAGRAEAARLSPDSPSAFERGALEAQADLLDARPVPVAALAEMARSTRDARRRALEAADVAALAAQVAWTCGRDDVAAAEPHLPLVGEHAHRVLLRGYWLPTLALMVAITAGITIVSSLGA